MRCILLCIRLSNSLGTLLCILLCVLPRKPPCILPYILPCVLPRILPCILLITSLQGAAAEAVNRPAENPGKPNILFIMSDDHTTQAVGAYGGRLAALDPTPTIDRLAEAGTRFDRVFVTNSICTPSRASIITGQYSQTNGVLDLDGKIVSPGRKAAQREVAVERGPLRARHLAVVAMRGEQASVGGGSTQALPAGGTAGREDRRGDAG